MSARLWRTLVTLIALLMVPAHDVMSGQGAPFAIDVTVVGRVLDTQAHPLPARIQVLAESGGQPGAPPQTVETDGDGRFTFRMASAKRPALMVSVGTVKFVMTAPCAVREPRRLDCGDIPLNVGLAIEGVVTRAADGAKVPQAAVTAERHDARNGAPRETLEVASLADGRFIIPRLESGAYALDVVAAGLERRHLVARTADRSLHVQLMREAVIAGVVSGADDRWIPADLSITATLVAEALEWKEYPDPRGRFTFHHLAPGTYTVAFESPDREPLSISDVLIEPGAVRDLGVVRIRKGAEIVGAVRDTAGDAVVGATVAARYAAGSKEAFKTNSDGTFRLAGLPAGEVVLVVHHEKYATARHTLSIAPGNSPSVVEITMGMGGDVTGSASTTGGAAIADAEVTLSWPSGTSVNEEPARQVITDSEGRFRFEHATPGTAVVRLVSTTGRQHAAETAQPVDIRDGQSETVRFIVHTVSVQGVVTQNGAPSRGVTIRLSSAESGADGWASAETDPQGAYLMADAPVGQVIVELATPDGHSALPLPARATIAPDRADQRLDIEIASRKLAGLVLDADNGMPINGALVAVSPTQAGVRASAETRPDGSFEIGIPGDGRYAVSASARGYGDRRDVIDLRADERFVLRLTKGRPLTGRVVSAAGVGIADAVVIASQLGDRAIGIAGMAVTTGDGAFAVRNLLDVPYSVLARSELAGFGVLSDVIPGNGDIVIPLTPGEPAELKIVGPDDAPVKGAAVTIAAIEGVRVAMGDYFYTDHTGTVAFTVPVGVVTLQVLAGGATTTSTIVVRRGAPTKLVVRMNGR